MNLKIDFLGHEPVGQEDDHCTIHQDGDPAGRAGGIDDVSNRPPENFLSCRMNQIPVNEERSVVPDKLYFSELFPT
jgi:hypothetical protein